MAYPRNRFFIFQDPEYIFCGCGNFYDDSPEQAEPRELAYRGCKRLNMTSILEKYGTAISDVMKEIRTWKRRFQSVRHAESRLRDYIRKANDRMYDEAFEFRDHCPRARKYQEDYLGIDSYDIRRKGLVLGQLIRWARH